MSETERQIMELFRCLDNDAKRQFHDLVNGLAEMNRNAAKGDKAAGKTEAMPGV